MAKRKRFQKQGKGSKKKKPAARNSPHPQVNNSQISVNDKPEKPPAMQYRPAMCRELLEHTAKGGTLPEFAFRTGVTMNELNEWGKLHPEFRRAMELAVLGREAYWWQLARVSMNEKFNAAVWKYIMEQINGRQTSPERKSAKNENLQDQYVLIFPELEDIKQPGSEGTQDQ
ncbi:MAG: hypothetical protein ACM3Q2_12015 [Syntrophothermus sp.]